MEPREDVPDGPLSRHEFIPAETGAAAGTSGRPQGALGRKLGRGGGREEVYVHACMCAAGLCGRPGSPKSSLTPGAVSRGRSLKTVWDKVGPKTRVVEWGQPQKTRREVSAQLDTPAQTPPTQNSLERVT